MAKAKYACPNCGEPVVAARWDAGYQYCKEKACFEALGRKKSITMFDRPPDPTSVDVQVYDLDDVASLYGEVE